MKKFKIVEIGPYPPPNSGWSVRIRFLKEAFLKEGHDCKVLNIGEMRKIKSADYMDVQSGFDYVIKLILLRLKGYHFHVHMNAQAVKGPILSLIALIISLMSFEKASLTFHGGIQQLYFPKENAGKMYGIIYLNFLLSCLVVCNNDRIKEHIVQYGPWINPKKIHPIPAFSVQYLNYRKTELAGAIVHFIRNYRFIIVCYIVLREGFYIEALAAYLKRLRADAGVILIGIREVEDESIAESYLDLQKTAEKGQILMIENLEHEEFLTLLSESSVYLRTPISDGLASSVLEALTLNTPVVASENGRRPEGVITYTADDANDMALKINAVLDNLAEFKKNLRKPFIRDTVKEETELLINAFGRP